MAMQDPFEPFKKMMANYYGNPSKEEVKKAAKEGFKKALNDPRVAIPLAAMPIPGGQAVTGARVAKAIAGTKAVSKAAKTVGKKLKKGITKKMARNIVENYDEVPKFFKADTKKSKLDKDLKKFIRKNEMDKDFSEITDEDDFNRVVKKYGLDKENGMKNMLNTLNVKIDNPIDSKSVQRTKKVVSEAAEDLVKNKKSHLLTKMKEEGIPKKYKHKNETNSKGKKKPIMAYKPSKMQEVSSKRYDRRVSKEVDDRLSSFSKYYALMKETKELRKKRDLVRDAINDATRNYKRTQKKENAIANAKKTGLKKPFIPLRPAGSKKPIPALTKKQAFAKWSKEIEEMDDVLENPNAFKGKSKITTDWQRYAERFKKGQSHDDYYDDYYDDY